MLLRYFFILSKNGMITYNEGYLLISSIILFITINIFEYKKENMGKVKFKKILLKKRVCLLMELNLLWEVF